MGSMESGDDGLTANSMLVVPQTVVMMLSPSWGALEAAVATGVGSLPTRFLKIDMELCISLPLTRSFRDTSICLGKFAGMAAGVVVCVVAVAVVV